MVGLVFSLFQRFSFCHSLHPFSASLGALAFHLEKNTTALLSPLILSLFAGTATFGSGGLLVVEQGCLPLIHSLSFFKFHFCFDFGLQLPNLHYQNESIHS